MELLYGAGSFVIRRVAEISDRGPWTVFLGKSNCNSLYVIPEARPDNDFAFDFLETGYQFCKPVIVYLNEFPTVCFGVT